VIAEPGLPRLRELHTELRGTQQLADKHLVYVRFEQEWQHLVTLRPHHLRLLDAPDGP
jgi:hypothetical protein